MARETRKDADDAIRITTASAGPGRDIAARQKRYVISMAIRTVCFIGAIVTGIEHVNWAWPALIVAALVLPYVAVVMANAANTKGDGFALQDSPYGRPELRGGAAWRRDEKERERLEEQWRESPDHPDSEER
jgi:hypothetical protein